MRCRRRSWLGALGTVLLLLSGCSGSDTADADIDSNSQDSAADTIGAPDDDPGDDESTEEDDGAEGDDATAEPRDPAEPFSVGTVYDVDAQPVMGRGVTFGPGTFRTGAVGTPMSFTTTAQLSTQINGGGMFVVTDIASRAPDDRDLVFLRVGAFSDPATPSAPIDEQTTWPNDDFLGWLENLDDSVVATDPVETAVNGFAAIRVDLELDDDIECGWLPGFCVGLIENNNHEIKALNKGASYRVWIVEQGDEDPIGIVAAIARDEDATWFERADAVMDTISFGDLEPNPAQALVVGENSLNALGGVEVSLPDNVAELTNGLPRLVNQWTGRGYAFIPIHRRPAIIEFSDRPHDVGGNPLDSVDDVIAELASAGVELTELESTTIAGVDTRVFDMTNTEVGAIMLRFSPLDVTESYLGWDAPAAGRMWLIEHPDRGLMMINGKVFDEVDELLPSVIELTEAIVESLSFTP